MTNPHDAAFATMPTFDSDGKACDMGEYGLTKREYFAAMAMQGMVAKVANPNGAGLIADIAASAVRCSDAIIEALNKQP